MSSRVDKSDGDDDDVRQPQSMSSPEASKVKSESLVWNHLTATIKPTLLAEAQLILLTIFTGMQGEFSIQKRQFSKLNPG